MIKQIILNFKFVQESFKAQNDILIDQARQEERVKAFSLAQKDILETMRDDLDKQAEELAKYKLAQLLSVVDMDKVVTVDKSRGIVYIGGVQVEEGRLANLKSEADAIEAFDLWHLLSETPKELAHKAMFVAGESITDMAKGRSMLYTLSSQKNIIEIFKSFKPKK